MEESKQKETLLADILTNIAYAVICDYPSERKRTPTRAIVNSKLHKMLIEVGAVTLSSWEKSSPGRIFKDFPEVRVFERQEIEKNYSTKILEDSKAMSMPLILAYQGWVNPFKKPIHYNLDCNTSMFIQALA